MRVLIILLFNLAFISNCFCQSEKDMREGKHIFIYAIELTQCNITGVTTNQITSIRENTTFKIIKEINDFYVIQIVKFWGSKSSEFDMALVKNNNYPVFFYLSHDNYDDYAERYPDKGSFNVGASTSLIKMRPGRKKLLPDGTRIYSEFGNDFNIGFSAGWKYTPNRKRDFSHSGVVSLSFSSVKVTPYTTKNFLETESSQACVTMSAGYILEYQKFQVSIFSGYDIMSGEVGKNWIYRNRPWIALGFGYQIFVAQGADNQKAPKAAPPAPALQLVPGADPMKLEEQKAELRVEEEKK